MSEVSSLIRIFVSSTFADFVSEREVLQRIVFPRLRTLCASHGCRFQPIDLRWGISEEASNEKRTVAICLEEIARCQRLSPDLNFLILLGDRYGSCFLPERIPSEQVMRLLPYLTPAQCERFIQTYTEDQSVLLPAFAEDQNAQPPEYALLPGPRTEEVCQEEVRLQIALAQAAESAGFSEQERLPFVGSATHLEIQRGLLNAGCNPAATVCAFRSTSAAKPGEPQTTSNMESPEQRVHLEALKAAVERRLDGRLWRYTVPGETTGPSIDLTAQERNEALAKQFFALLEPRVRDALACRQAIAQTRDPATEANHRFATTRTSVMIGRDPELAKVSAYLTGQTSRPLVVTGASGVGKSTLLAQVMNKAIQVHPNAVVVTRFIGVTPGTSSLTDLLSGLRREIAGRYGQMPPEPPGNLSQLVDAVMNQLRTQAVPAERPLFLIVDALDQLGTQQHNVNWLPQTLAPNVRIVVSTLADRQEQATLRTRLPAEQVLQLEPLPRALGANILRQWLAREGRQLTPAQEKTVLDGFAPAPEGTEGMGMPLYLHLAFEQARSWHSFDQETRLESTIPKLIKTYFERLEKPGQHGRDLVAYALGYIAAAKRGLTEDELLDLLSRSETVRTAMHELNKEWPRIEAQLPLPMALWARLAADLEYYLTEREADGAWLITFYHQQVREEAEAIYLDEIESVARHNGLATYFGEQPYRLSADGAEVWNQRKLAELAYQQKKAGPEVLQALEITLTDARFLEGKLTVEGIVATLDDLSFAQSNEDIAKIATAIRAGANVLTKDPAEWLNQITGRFGQVAQLHHLPERMTPWLRLRPRSLEADPGLLHILQGHTGNMSDCVLSEDGERALSASEDGTLRFWDTKSGETLLILRGHKSEVFGCALSKPLSKDERSKDERSKDERRALSASEDGTLRFWDTASGETLRILRGHKGSVRGCALSADGRWALSFSALRTRQQMDRVGFEETTLWFWDTESGQRLCILKGHTGPVMSCALSADGRRALSASLDGTLQLWDTKSGRWLHRVRSLGSGRMLRCALSADGQWALALSASNDMRLWLWDIQNRRTFRLKGHTSWATSCALSADGWWALSGSVDGTLWLWDTRNRQMVHTLQGHTNLVGYCALSEDGGRALSASASGGEPSASSEHSTLRFWDTASKEALHTLERHRKAVIGCVLSADGHLALSASEDGMLRLWDAESDHRSWHTLRTLKGHVNSTTSCALSKDGQLAISISASRTLCLWNTDRGTTLHTLRSLIGKVTSCALSADGLRALSVSGYQIMDAPGPSKLQVWDAISGRRPYLLKTWGTYLGTRSLRVKREWTEKRNSIWEETRSLKWLFPGLQSGRCYSCQDNPT